MQVLPLFKSVTLTLALGLPLSVSALECEKGTLVDVIGETNTTNLGPEVQEGYLDLTLIDVDSGEVVFDSTCAIIGQVEEIEDATKRLLSHQVACGGRDDFQTRDDEAKLVLPPLALDGYGNPCAFSADEVISNIANSAGLFRNMTADIDATGTVRFCSEEDNNNSFVLEGKACLKNLK